MRRSLKNNHCGVTLTLFIPVYFFYSFLYKREFLNNLPHVFNEIFN